MTVRAESYEWAAFALGTLGVPFRAEGPAEFLDVLRDWSARLARGAEG